MKRSLYFVVVICAVALGALRYLTSEESRNLGVILDDCAGRYSLESCNFKDYYYQTIDVGPPKQLITVEPVTGRLESLGRPICTMTDDRFLVKVARYIHPSGFEAIVVEVIDMPGYGGLHHFNLIGEKKAVSAILVGQPFELSAVDGDYGVSHSCYLTR